MIQTTTVRQNAGVEPEVVLHETLRNRRSPKVFLHYPIERETLVSLFEAARWSPSSRNEQPWRFVVGRKHEGVTYQRVFESLTEPNKSWAHQAPVLVAVIAKQTFDRDGSYNRSAVLDVGGAVANLTVQAVSRGLQVHTMAGFDREKIRTSFDIPSGFEPVVVLAIGYADEAHLLPFHQRQRHPLSSLVFEGSWGRTAGFLTAGDRHASVHD